MLTKKSRQIVSAITIQQSTCQIISSHMNIDINKGKLNILIISEIRRLKSTGRNLLTYIN